MHGDGKIMRNSKDYCRRALVSICDDSCALLLGASKLGASEAKSYQKKGTTVGFDFQGAQICDSFELFGVSSGKGTVPTQACIRGRRLNSNEHCGRALGSMFDDGGVFFCNKLA